MTRERKLGESPTWEVREGDALTQLRLMPNGSVQCCVTSPPYFGLRNYGVDGQIGLESTPDQYVARLVEVFREVRRVLRGDGTLWLNLGDAYAANAATRAGQAAFESYRGSDTQTLNRTHQGRTAIRGNGIKAKDLLGIPWMVAFALRVDGWYLRSEIIWAKPNPMPESVRDRPTKAHEQVFLLAKSKRYYYDADAIREPSDHPHLVGKRQKVNYADVSALRNDADSVAIRTADRNKRSVWEIATQPYPDAHFATFPPKLVEPMVLAGCPEGGVVLDPFAGAGTTGVVALRHGRSFIGIELNGEYVELARNRIVDDAPLLNLDSAA